MNADEFGQEFTEPIPKRASLRNAVKGNRHEQLEAMRDYIAHQLEGNQCKSCKMSQLRTGDQAALLLRLQQVLEALDNLPAAESEDEIERLMRQTDELVHKTSNSRNVEISGRRAPRRSGGSGSRTR